MAKYLLKDAGNNADSGWINVSDCFDRADQQSGNLYIDGVMSGATVAILARPKGSSRSGVTFENGEFTAPDCKQQEFSPDLQIKATTSGGDGSTDVDVWLG